MLDTIYMERYAAVRRMAMAALQSDSTGQTQIHVQPFDGIKPRHQKGLIEHISTDTGGHCLTGMPMAAIVLHDRKPALLDGGAGEDGGRPGVPSRKPGAAIPDWRAVPANISNCRRFARRARGS